MLVISIFLLCLQCFLPFPKQISVFQSFFFFFFPAKAFSLDQSKILSCGKELNPLSAHFCCWEANWIIYTCVDGYSGSFEVLNLKKLTLSQATNFRLFQTERGCRRQFQIWWKWQKVLQMGRKHCGKRRNCLLKAISPFPTLFSKDLYCRHVKIRACLGTG